MITITIQAGNTDNKLSQQEWSNFVRKLDGEIRFHAEDIHFFGGSENWALWQNVAWIIVTDRNRLEILKSQVMNTREAFYQSSVAWTEGATEFV